jgi:nicotinamidase-related amidase/alkylated DNA repair dioxygenase AlkB
MSSAFLDLLKQKRPDVKTKQALLVLGLQNDFVHPEGKLHVNSPQGFINQIKELVPVFREYAGDVIWIKNEYQQDRRVNDASGDGDIVLVNDSHIDSSTEDSGDDGLGREAISAASASGKPRSSRHKQRAVDLLKRISARKKSIRAPSPMLTAPPPVEEEELFLSRGPKKAPCCIPGSPGHEFATIIKDSVDIATDSIIHASHYSAFNATHLLMSLRAKLVTELYMVGCLSNVSIYATALDAARHGLSIYLLEDCLGYRKQSRHEEAMKQIMEVMGAQIISSKEIIAVLSNPPTEKESASASSRKSRHSADAGGGEASDLHSLVGNLRLQETELSRPRSAGTQMRTGPLSKNDITTPKGQRSESPPKQQQPPASGKSPANDTRPSQNPRSFPAPPPISRATEQLLIEELEALDLKKSPADDSQLDSRPSTDILASSPASSHRSARSRYREQPVPDPKTGLVKQKIRMRHRPKKEGESASKESKKGEEKSTSPPIETRTEDLQEAPLPDTKRDNESSATATTTAAIHSEGKKKATETPPKKDHALKGVKSTPLLSTPNPKDGTKREKSPISPVSARPHSMHIPESINTTPLKASEKLADAKPFTSPKTSKEPASSNNTTSSKEAVPSTNSSQNSPLKSPKANASVVMGKKTQSLATFPTLGPNDKICEGDSKIIYDLFDDQTKDRKTHALIKEIIFSRLYNEVHWQKMYHAQGEVPRLVCCQGQFGKDGSMPVYRHPSDQSLPLLHFSPAVQQIRERAEKLVSHPLNHVLIQLYRSGNDYISEHSDKTLDIVRGSKIVNVSFGAQRTMRLRTKRSAKPNKAKQTQGTEEKEGPSRDTQRVAMPHNSMFVLGQESNMRWLHGINADKRPDSDRSELEKAYDGMRISLTFRNIGTFLDADSRLIWGQGATSKLRAEANDTINDDEDKTQEIINAFGLENQSTEFDWDAVYGGGFDVLHFRKPPTDDPILFLSNDQIDNRAIVICLAELGITHTVCDAPVADMRYEDDRQVCYRDSDTNHTEVSGALNILLYLDRFHQLDRAEAGKAVSASVFPLLIQLDGLRKELTTALSGNSKSPFEGYSHLADIEETAERNKGDFIAGNRFSIADCFAWPIVDALIEAGDTAHFHTEAAPTLLEWYKRTWKRKKTLAKIRKNLPEI